MLMLIRDTGTCKSFSRIWQTYFYISLYKAQGPIGTCCNLVHMRVPAEVVRNVHPKVPGTGDCLQDLVMEYMLSTEGGPGRSHLYNLALNGVKLHIPFAFPRLVNPNPFISSHCHAEIQWSNKWQSSAKYALCETMF